jgi:Protein of unknown function (DUF4238)
MPHNALTGRKDHWLPQGYMKGFIGPSRKNEARPLFCFEKETQRWRPVSTKEIGQGEGFYDYADGTDYSAVTHPDSVFARLEREFRPKLGQMASDNFASWHQFKDFLIEFMHMLRARSPMAMEQQRAYALSRRGAKITNIVAHPTNTSLTGVVLDTMTPYQMPEPIVRNMTIAEMLADVQSNVLWPRNMDWCLRYTEDEANPYCSTDQAIIVQGTLEAPAVTPEVLAHPDTIVIFPLCWQACMFGSPLKFDKPYDRAHPQQPLSIRTEQKQRCDRFVISPVMY